MVFINNLFRDNEAQGNHSVCGAGHSILIIVDSEVLDYPDIIFESNSIEGFNYINDQYNDYVSYARFSPSNYSFYNMNLNYISNNNIYNNPLLFDNYKIDNTSPCFDSGYQTTANEDDYIQYSLSHDVDGENRIAGLSIDIGAYEYNDICLMPSINEIVLGGINPDSPRRYKFNVANISNTQWVNNISFETTENLEDILQINAERSSLQPNSTMTVELNFYPNKMYQNYSGYIVINSDDILNTKMMIPFSANTHLHSGWNWVSFPLISGNVSDELLFDILNPHGLEIMDQNNSATYNNGIWDANEIETVYSNSLYKIKMADNSEVYDIPFNMEDTQTSITLYPGIDNYVGYWLNESKDMRDAFGDNFDKVTSMKSEKWSYAPIQINPKKDISIGISPSWKTHPLHKGRGYIVRVSEIIQGFRWGDSNIIYYSPTAKSEVTNFDYQDDSDYVVLDVINIDEGVNEIGAFQGDTCIGAASVENNQAQILLYPSTVRADGIDVRLEYVVEEKKSYINEMFVYDFKKDDFSFMMNIVLGESYYLVSLGNPYTLDDILPIELKLHRNYPNPFNPSTTIAFDIPIESEVKLEVYNIKGQKVKNLVKDIYQAGTYNVVWNGDNNNGKQVASGIYFYRLSTNDKSLVEKMILMK